MSKKLLKSVKNPLSYCVRWKAFTGQILKTGDILWTKNGLAFVDSGYTSGCPSRISSIPEDWNFTFENNGINQRTKKGESDEYILPNGKFYYTGLKGRGKIGGQILFVCTLIKPI